VQKLDKKSPWTGTTASANFLKGAYRCWN